MITDTEYYKEFLTFRSVWEPMEWGIDKEKEEFIEQMVDTFDENYGNVLSFDELLLRPQEAAHFCAKVRRTYDYFDLPDDIILRSVKMKMMR